ncbi:MAG: UDP-N-acetylglucosamine--LPS N-acetylglucosamine transferase [Mojavia pulchra JT2-VF2]|uniref:UDP-N-acetylglucosamine--LPS N-acetylglucosamine transferase n=1 Tax=Mojavia pulchra JT2-VF2 TaxID=287848 RepID=A0A951Q0U4_9NOST|nr:UDP-N-acetylglucosamine--LPS N-acetylglucosamine transferase [Mojavia pulchra JT2-VF2]
MGAGHRSTANALKEVIEKRKLPWDIQVVEVFKEVFETTTNHYIYNELILKKKWAKMINDPLLVPLFRLVIKLRHSVWRNLLRKYWREHQPDLVVSLLPLVNRVLYESLQAELPETPFVTSITDFADCPPNFWIEPQEQFLICPSQRAVQQAQSFGYPEQRIFRTSGVVIHPRFNQPVTGDRSFERQRLGLDPNLPTGLVIFGSHGSKEMIEIAERLEKSSLNLQLIFICGRNEKLAQDLRNIPSRFPKYVEGFTKQIPHYMHLCDFFIGKPGSVGISEAIAMNLPVITECNNITTLFQERASADWLADNGFGIVVENFRDINKAVAELIEPENFSRYWSNVKAYNNQAVFEVVDTLERILESSLPVAVSPQVDTSNQLSSTV